jgi:uncharacterized protein YggE
MAKSSGRTLGGVVSVTEAADSSSGYPKYDMASAYGSVAMLRASPAPVLPGQQDQTARISVVFKLQ